MKTDILLVNPSLGYNSTSKYPPLSLITIASFLEATGNYNVVVLDAQALDMTDDEVIAYINKMQPLFCGFTLMTPQANYVAELIRRVKKSNKNITVIAGGVHVSIVPEDFLQQCPEVDYLIIGEGENTMLALLEAANKQYSTDDISGLAYIKEGKITINSRRELIKDLDTLPMPAWSKLPIDKYEVVTPERFSKPTSGNGLTLSSERGCPFKCTFCASGNVFDHSFRSKSPKKIIEEIKILISEFNIRNFFFVDEVLTLKEATIVELCDLIIQNRLDIKWSCNSRCNSKGLNNYTVQKMKAAGCMRIDFGVESGAPHVLKSIKKQIKLEDVYSAHKLAHDAGMYTTTLMIVGLPEERLEDFKDSLKLVLFLESEVTCFGAATPFPGTELYNTTVNNSHLKVKSNDWQEFYIGNKTQILRTSHFDYNRIQELADYANSVCAIVTVLSNYKRHEQHNLSATIKLFFCLLLEPDSKLTFEDRMLWIELFLKKRIDSRYINNTIDNMLINTQVVTGNSCVQLWKDLPTVMPEKNSSPTFLIVCKRSNTGVESLVSTLENHYSKRLAIVILHGNNVSVNMKINNQNKYITITNSWLSGKTYDRIFHFDNQKDIVSLSGHVVRSLLYTIRGRCKKQYIVSPNVRFWELNINNIIKTLTGIDSSLGKVCSMTINLPLMMCKLLFLSFKTKELHIVNKIIPTDNQQ